MLSLGEELLKYQEQEFLSFHTPGHKGKSEFFKNLNFPEQDLTELPGLDMLHAPQGVIAKAQKRAAQVFGAEESFFLVNGATVGNQAMFLALAGTKGKVLIERQSHRSVMAGLVLSGLEPVYIKPVVHPEFHLPLGYEYKLEPQLWREIQGVHLTYPSYYGTLSDVSPIVQGRDLWGSSVPILVDQAHGSHYLSKLFPPGALEWGADLVLHSSHKTLSALTQAAMLHVQGERISRNRLKQGLELLQSSSPSYLLMASLERAVEYAQEEQRWKLLFEAVQELHQRVGKVLRILNLKDKGRYGIAQLDWSKILINTSSIGLAAPLGVQFLRKYFRIEPELWDQENILFLLGIGNTLEEVQRLTEGLIAMVQWAESEKDSGLMMINYNENRGDFVKGYEIPLPSLRLTPREAFLAPKRQIPLKESLGKILGESISPYPPGIPWVVMGEEMTPELLEALLDSSSKSWQGWESPEKGVWVIEEG
ncbi:arginine/lysine/ornithine decarboxylase [Desulfitobacterium metallireducens DSM 15288]|uniref:Arginine/lysine/ornithine decarboxylase n=1 Tax=Desulfitobacterium metallireducens DSM 15288 TaxID=871968 RepID=W0E860_9FIRM|nr:arginine/lysine/ornithine decarboxylase [Desulfitobacterium metallireducens DSM 15288]